jgi:hypothetical protein
MEEARQHRDIRLCPENYLGCRWYFVTLCAHDRVKYFLKKTLCDWVLRVLREESTRNWFLVKAYCLMPDHLHLLLQGSEDTVASVILRSYSEGRGRTRGCGVVHLVESGASRIGEEGGGVSVFGTVCERLGCGWGTGKGVGAAEGWEVAWRWERKSWLKRPALH